MPHSLQLVIVSLAQHRCRYIALVVAVGCGRILLRGARCRGRASLVCDRSPSIRSPPTCRRCVSLTSQGFPRRTVRSLAPSPRRPRSITGPLPLFPLGRLSRPGAISDIIRYMTDCTLRRGRYSIAMKRTNSVGLETLNDIVRTSRDWIALGTIWYEPRGTG